MHLARPWIPLLMNPLTMALLALAMSTDAFAAAVGKGMSLRHPHWREALRTGAIFGVIEGFTPVLGWALGVVAADYVKAWDHWIAFLLLCGLGLHMAIASLRSPASNPNDKPNRHGFWLLAATGFATSVDAMVVGVGLAFIDAPIVPVALAIGFTTFVAVTLGVMLGRVLGTAAGRRAELVGGLVLIGIGAVILFEHLSGAA